MKTEWLVVIETPGVSPDRAEHATQEMILDVSLTNSGRFCTAVLDVSRGTVHMVSDLSNIWCSGNTEADNFICTSLDSS